MIKALRKKYEEGLGHINLEEFKSISGWEDIFGDLSRMPTSTIDYMVKSINELTAANSLSITEAKELVKALEKLRGVSIERQPVKGLAEAKKNIEDWKRIQREFNTTGSYTLDRDFGGYKAGTSLKQKDIEDGVQGAYSDQTKAVNVLTARFAALAEAIDLIAGLLESFGGVYCMIMAGSVISGGAYGGVHV